MNAIIVADAGPLIALAKIGHLNLLHQMYGEVLIPPAILKELAVDTHKPGSALLKTALSDGWLQVIEIPLSKDKSLLELLLDAGEVEAILLAEKLKCRFLLIDERSGRVVAKKRGIAIVGVCGILLLAKEQGFIFLVVPLLNQLLNIGYRLSSQLILEVTNLAEE
ncbi:MAG: DUF3368 domain-containing protein [Candidatus Parabeggiatoa sp. nov. 3]|nr:MAG: DUF3368 domain-containing protein [Gammaproteobacteria bacterium]RKZ59592.1 MAG: DUF3368 domain-containing protein [Gammaproteobacteria bacterium]